MKHVSSRRQTLLFSATFDAAVEQLAVKSLKSPQRFSTGTDAPSSTVAHTLYPVPQHLKPGLLQRLLDEMNVHSILVFTRTKHRADRVTEKIKRAGYAASALHSNKSQNQRKQAMDQFRTGQIKVLVATDIAARGLDVASISHVINFDIPDSATSYIHRIGRTGRAERLGDAYTLVTQEDKQTIRDIEKILGTPIERKVLDNFNYNEAMEKNVRAFPLPQVQDRGRVRSQQRRYA
jgi:ATP-dependent RNA helicase RhlE